MDELKSKLKCFFGSGPGRGLFIFGNFMHSDLKWWLKRIRSDLLLSFSQSLGAKNTHFCLRYGESKASLFQPLHWWLAPPPLHYCASECHADGHELALCSRWRLTMLNRLIKGNYPFFSLHKPSVCCSLYHREKWIVFQKQNGVNRVANIGNAS